MRVRKLRTWTLEEEDWLKEWYPQKGKDFCCSFLKRSEACVRHKASRLGLCTSQDLKNRVRSEKLVRRGRFRYKEVSARLVSVLDDDRKFWHGWQLDFLRENYFDLPSEEIVRVTGRSWEACIHKACRLGLVRNQEKFRLEGIREFNRTDNPAWRPEVQEKQRQRMKDFIKNDLEGFKKQVNKRDEKGMTKIESIIAGILEKNNITYIFDETIIVNGMKPRPDFRIGRLVIEAYGHRYHSKDFIESDKQRIRKIIDAGFSVLIFRENRILSRPEVVERCILKRLGQLNLSEAVKQ